MHLHNGSKSEAQGKHLVGAMSRRVVFRMHDAPTSRRDASVRVVNGLQLDAKLQAKGRDKAGVRTDLT
jgi:hypothetical protein